MNLLMAPTISKAKGHKLLGNQCARGRAAKVQRIFEPAMTDFTEQLRRSWYVWRTSCRCDFNAT